LFSRVQARDVDALGELYERFSRQAFGLAYRMLSDRQRAEEVVQDAFMSAWRQAETYRPGAGRVKPWLLSIVHHRAIDLLRRKRDRVPSASLDEAWMMAATTDVFGDVYRGLQREEIRVALAQLPGEQRQAIELAYFQGNSFVEIAAIAGTPVGTVKSRVRLGLGKLRELLSEAQR
jgi:RNA polymerase sigma-70 factor (ECF subfamily)